MLIEMVVVMAVLAMLIAVAWPMLGRGTGATRLAADAIDIMTLLRQDRSKALATGQDTVTMVDLEQRAITSSSDRTIRLAPDEAIDVLSSEACTVSPRRFAVLFRADGTSCGGVLRLGKGKRGYEIQVNWLTGAVRAQRF
jgi:general secretion pathway protein H